MISILQAFYNYYLRDVISDMDEEALAAPYAISELEGYQKLNFNKPENLLECQVIDSLASTFHLTPLQLFVPTASHKRA